MEDQKTKVFSILNHVNLANKRNLKPLGKFSRVMHFAVDYEKSFSNLSSTECLSDCCIRMIVPLEYLVLLLIMLLWDGKNSPVAPPLHYP